jgi:hypothetical protein
MWRVGVCCLLISCGPAPKTFAEASNDALATMSSLYFDSGAWQYCAPTSCFIGAGDMDWGADSMTYALWLRWNLNKDPSIASMMTALDSNGPHYGKCTAATCTNWSDVPMWDSVAASREYQVSGAATALARAKESFDFVDTATEFSLGACPTIFYQQPGGGANLYKTLESDSNYLKAALLLFEITGDNSYVQKAVSRYPAIRQYYLDPQTPLYSTQLFDDGVVCTQTPHRFFASVNGNMIWAGVRLAQVTGMRSYLDDAVATGQAFSTQMSDANGVFADLQAESDVIEPLIEGMYALATDGGQQFAADFLTSNAKAAIANVSAAGVYPRFFDGPVPPQATIWQSSGGLALAFAAAALTPNERAESPVWSGAQYTTQDILLADQPISLTITGRAVALVGTIGENCCYFGHARVFVDGTETFDQRGIWQNQDTVSQSIDNSILFAWRWPTAGTHTLTFQPGISNAKEGDSFLHIQGYFLVP